jgi:hypothetical protein
MYPFPPARDDGGAALPPAEVALSERIARLQLRVDVLEKQIAMGKAGYAVAASRREQLESDLFETLDRLSQLLDS